MTRKKYVSKRLHFVGLFLLLLCFLADSRNPRQNGFEFFGKQKKSGSDSISFPETDNDKLDKRLAILRHQSSISRDELMENVIKGLLTITGMVFYYRLFSQIGQSLGNAGESLISAFKPDYKSGDNLGLHPNVTKLLKPNCTLNSFELEILQTVTDPSQSEHSFKGLGGLRDIKLGLYHCVTGLISPEEVGGEGRIKPISGVLLFGPPGCGKTALIQALSKKTNIPIIRIIPSMLLRKYVGETPRITRAIFTAAAKIQPCMVFIDEMDALFRARQSNDQDHGHSRDLITEFMQLWDDLAVPTPGPNGSVGASPRVMIVGATNRPQDLDAAVQRRFQRSFLVGPPDKKTRAAVFRAILRGVTKSSDMDFEACASLTDGYTSSDITALCGAAVSVLQQERRTTVQKRDTALARKYREENKNNNNKTKNKDLSSLLREVDGDGIKGSEIPLRPLRMQDIELAMQSVYPTTWAASSYGSLSAQQEQASAYNAAAAAASAQTPDYNMQNNNQNSANYDDDDDDDDDE